MTGGGVPLLVCVCADVSIRERVVRRLDDLGPLVICADLAELRAMLFPLVGPAVTAAPAPALGASVEAVPPSDEPTGPRLDAAGTGAPAGSMPSGAPGTGPVPAGSVPTGFPPSGSVSAGFPPSGSVPAGSAAPGLAGPHSPTSANPGASPDGTLRLGDLAVDPADHLVTWRGEPLALTRLERELLARLATSPVIVWSYARLFATVWGGAYLGDSAILHSAVKRLRRKLRAVEGGPQIQTVRGIGYRLAVPLPAQG